MTETRPEFHTALHQAGHAVAAHVVELPFGYVSLEQDQGSLSYQLHNGGTAAQSDPQMAERLATVSMAGRAAQEIYAGTVPADPLDPPDRDLAARAGESNLDAAATRAREILTACWPAVMSLADLLITRNRVTAKDVQITMRSTCPAMERPIHEGVADATASAPRRPTGVADSEDDAASMPEGALAGGIDEGGGD